MNADREESLAWDRVGRFLQQSGTKASDIADRNVRLWSSVAQHLKQDRYTADDMADDVARSISTAMDNMSDAWAVLTQDPRENRVAQPVPTAFLLFDSVGPSQHRLLDPVWIEAGQLSGNRANLPDSARVELTGTRRPLSEDQLANQARGSRFATSEEGVRRLRERLVAYRDGKTSAYILTNVNRTLQPPNVASAELKPVENAEPGDGDPETGLVPGVYDGIVYLIDPAVLLASVRVVVEGPPPESEPLVSEEKPDAKPQTF